MIGPQQSGLREAAEQDPKDTSEAIRELAAWLPAAQLEEVTWAAELESRWNPHAENPNGGAVGVWQFMPATLKGLGTDASTVRHQGRADQARLLAKMWGRRAPRRGDAYLRLFWPAAEGKPDDYLVAEPGSAVWKANPSLQQPGGGAITAGSVRAKGKPMKGWPRAAEMTSWAGASKPSGSSGGFGTLLLVGIGALLLPKILTSRARR